MALKKRDRNIPFEDIPLKTGNRYLDEPEQGLALVARIISSDHQRQRQYEELDYLMDEKLLRSTGRLNLENELKLYGHMMALSDRLLEGKYHLLKNRTVIGLGGRFSAGKSLFINSILGRDELLPVDQAPTTSVPTYIISGDCDKVGAYTTKGASLELDAEAVGAISHGFQNTYGLGLAQYLSYLSVSVTGFQNGIALLDTPGYNKADETVIDAYTDSRKAYDQLRAVDCLIWLLDVSNGTLTDKDIKFIRELNLSTKILIVVNKCDLKTEKEYTAVVDQVKSDAIAAGIDLYEVVPYSSRKPDQYEGKDKILEFFSYARDSRTHTEDLAQEVKDIAGQIDAAFQIRSNELQSDRNNLGRAIFHSSKIFEIEALVELYGELNSTITDLNQDRIRFRNTGKKICEMISKL